MARKAEGPFKGPYVVELPPPSLEEILDEKFEGNRTPHTLAAARRIQAKPRCLRVPRNLMNQLWTLTGGWEQISNPFNDYVLGKKYYPSKRIADCSHGRKTNNTKRPWREYSRILKVGQLEVVFLSTRSGYPAYLRWQGWIFGDIGYYKWRTRQATSQVAKSLAQPMSSAQADDWGFWRKEDGGEEDD